MRAPDPYSYSFVIFNYSITDFPLLDFPFLDSLVKLTKQKTTQKRSYCLFICRVHRRHLTH